MAEVRRIRYDFADSLQHITTWCCCKFLCRSDWRMRRLTQKGMHRFERALDVSNIIEHQRSLKVLIRVLFDKKQRALLRLQKHSLVIDSASSESDDPHCEQLDDMQE